MRLTSNYTTGGFCQSYSGGLGEMRILSVGVVGMCGLRAHTGLIAGWGFRARTLFSCYEGFSGRIAGLSAVRVALYEWGGFFSGRLCGGVGVSRMALR